MLEHSRSLGVHSAFVHQGHAEDAARRFAAEQQVSGYVDCVAK